MFTAILKGILSFLAAVFTFFFTKPGIYITLLAIVGGLFYGTYYYSHAAGVAQGTRDTSAAYETRLAAERATSATALAEFKATSKATLDEISAKLTKAEKTAQITKIITKEITKYVTAESDAKCIIPRGFVRVHDQPITASTDGMAFGGATDDGSPSGIALSTVAATVADNYSECTLRGEVINLWQLWYRKNTNAFSTLIKDQAP